MVDTIELRALELDDFNQVLQWSKNEEFCLLNEWDINREEEELYEWWKNCCEIQHSFSFRRFGIEHDGRLIGYADLAEIKDDTAELGIAIGNSSLWGRGIGTYVLKELMKYGRETLGIKEFYAETKKTNSRSRNMLEKLGFKRTNMTSDICYYKLINNESV